MSRAEELLEWIVVFMDEHPEWTDQQFTEYGEANSETDWLAQARAYIHPRQIARRRIDELERRIAHIDEELARIDALKEQMNNQQRHYSEKHKK